MSDNYEPVESEVKNTPNSDRSNNHFERVPSIKDEIKEGDIVMTIENESNEIIAADENKNVKERKLTELVITEIIPTTEEQLEIEEEVTDEIEEASIKKVNVIFLTLNASLGFFFFGYNLVNFNTLQEHFAVIFNWSEEEKIVYRSVISGIIPFGALFGAFFSGKVTNLIGRKYSMLLFDMIGIGTNLFSMIVNSYVLVITKFIQGLCVGAYSTIVPLYINEYIPNSMSGLCGVIYNSFFCLGVLVSLSIGLNLPTDVNDTENSWWRFMFLFTIITNALNIFVLLVCFRHDTPKYYYINKKDLVNCKKALRMIFDNEKVIEKYIKKYEIEKVELIKQEVTYADLCSPRYMRRMAICIIFNMFMQLSFINGVGLYSKFIFLQTDPDNAPLFTSIAGISEYAGSLLTILTIEKLGRRTIAIGGFLICCLSHLTVSILYFIKFYDPVPYLIFFFQFIAGMSIDPIVWVYNADILPDKGVGIVTCINWMTAVVVIVGMPNFVISDIGLEGTFLMASILCFMATIFSIIFVKETKGKSKIEIEIDFMDFCSDPSERNKEGTTEKEDTEKENTDKEDTEKEDIEAKENIEIKEESIEVKEVQ